MLQHGFTWGGAWRKKKKNGKQHISWYEKIFNKLLKANCGLAQEYGIPGTHRHKGSQHPLMGSTP